MTASGRRRRRWVVGWTRCRCLRLRQWETPRSSDRCGRGGLSDLLAAVADDKVHSPNALADAVECSRRAAVARTGGELHRGHYRLGGAACPSPRMFRSAVPGINGNSPRKGKAAEVLALYRVQWGRWGGGVWRAGLAPGAPRFRGFVVTVVWARSAQVLEVWRGAGAPPVTRVRARRSSKVIEARESDKRVGHLGIGAANCEAPLTGQRESGHRRCVQAVLHSLSRRAFQARVGDLRVKRLGFARSPSASARISDLGVGEGERSKLLEVGEFLHTA